MASLDPPEKADEQGEPLEPNPLHLNIYLLLTCPAPAAAERQASLLASRSALIR